MRTRKLDWTDLNLTTIGLGTWAMGGGDWSFSWGTQDDEESMATISRAIEKGINWIDTAPGYGLGHSEEIVGKALWLDGNMYNLLLLGTICQVGQAGKKGSDI